MLTAKQISENFQISVRQVYKISKEMKINKGKDRQYHFPDDFRPIYIPDGRSYRSLKKSDRKAYVYIMDVIAKMLLAKDNYFGINEQIRRTVVRELKEAELIKLKVGAIETSLDYKDYVVSLSSGEWFGKKAKERENLILDAIEAVSKGASNGTTEALIEASK
jgi:hypothetical protein